MSSLTQLQLAIKSIAGEESMPMDVESYNFKLRVFDCQFIETLIMIAQAWDVTKHDIKCSLNSKVLTLVAGGVVTVQ